MRKWTGFLFSALVVLVFVLLAPASAFGGATVLLINIDGAGEGFNDPAPRTPVAGNNGTTLGQQRLNSVAHAAGIWAATLDSNVQINLLARFNPQTCTPTAATLASAGTLQIVANFAPNSPFPGLEANTWYGTSLANKRVGYDIITGPLGTTADDILATFNSNLGTGPGCLGGRDFYYGLDANHGVNIDLVATALHELGHGLNFQQFANVATGAQPQNLTDVYGKRILDLTTGKTWDQMTDAERAASAVNTRKVVFNGPTVTAAAPGVLALGVPFLRVNSPAGIAGLYEVGTATFGPPLDSSGVTGNVVLGDDGVAAAGSPPGTVNDGCEPLVGGGYAGQIVIVDRGFCGFTIKVKNAQDAGALAVIVADNVAGAPAPGMSGVDPTITIPSVRITLADGNTLKANLSGLNATMFLDMSVRAGTDPAGGRVLLYTPVPVSGGSTISHWDTSPTPNQLMEPSINAGLTHSVSPPQDLTLPLFRDLGWFPDADTDGYANDADACDASILTATVVIDGCDSGVPNTLLTDGCTISDQIAACVASSLNHGQFERCVTNVANAHKKSGLITGTQKEAIVLCANNSSLP
jgi:hypothetical protein